MIEHANCRNTYRRRIQADVFKAVVRLRAAGYRVYRDDDKHKIYFPKSGKVSFLDSADLISLAEAV